MTNGLYQIINYQRRTEQNEEPDLIWYRKTMKSVQEKIEEDPIPYLQNSWISTLGIDIDVFNESTERRIYGIYFDSVCRAFDQICGKYWTISECMKETFTRIFDGRAYLVRSEIGKHRMFLSDVEECLSSMFGAPHINNK